MNRILVSDDPTRALAPISVPRASAFLARIVGLSKTFTNVQVHFGIPGSAVRNVCVCTPRRNGEFNLYASPAYFGTVGASEYHITALTDQNDSIYLGKGTLTVVQSVLNVASAAVPPVPDDTYVRNPETGLYHKLTVVVEDGVLTPRLDTTGVTL